MKSPLGQQFLSYWDEK